MIDVFTFAIGSIIGSFLNVCITRIPERKSIISHPSSCPGCGRKIKKAHIIPIISYFWLGGKCFYCQWKIPKRYFVVELVTGVILVCLYRIYKFNPIFFQHAIFSFLLIIISFIDVECRLIFDRITIPGIFLGIGFNILINYSDVKNSIYGIIAGSGFLILVAIVGYMVFRKETVGGGDIKLAAMIGSFIGLNGIIFSVIIAVFSGAFIGMLFILIYKTKYIPFGPFLSFGAILYLLGISRFIMFLN
jgi:leader peptidase (prepilin peptidase)/N-methyltransferase